MNSSKGPFNAFVIGKQSQKTAASRTYVNQFDWQTQQALEELENIRSWDEFVEICEDQKRVRGW